MNKLGSKLFLIPNLIGDTSPEMVTPAVLPSIVESLKHFIVEDVRNARRYLRKLSKDVIIDDLEFYTLNKHTTQEEISTYLNAAKNGFNIGLISEAGLPCVADPGNVIVEMAHNIGLQVVPITGPSSIFLALMASGLNGQNFAFNGYLPVDQNQRVKKLKELEQKVYKDKQSQIFMDTPYRNNKMFDDIISYLSPNTYLCVAVNVTCEDEFIMTMKIAKWKNNRPDLHKKPCIFII
ncbi:MAG: SAM-dependent methyltransferase [Marinilabiliales bacterium]|nr:MAG: SAM-dependent methyltransferase [Marinilabiliales bacterium]